MDEVRRQGVARERRLVDQQHAVTSSSQQHRGRRAGAARTHHNRVVVHDDPSHVSRSSVSEYRSSQRRSRYAACAATVGDLTDQARGYSTQKTAQQRASRPHQTRARMACAAFDTVGPANAAPSPPSAHGRRDDPIEVRLRSVPIEVSAYGAGSAATRQLEAYLRRRRAHLRRLGPQHVHRLQHRRGARGRLRGRGARVERARARSLDGGADGQALTAQKSDRSTPGAACRQQGAMRNEDEG